MLEWTIKHARANMGMLGYIPSFLSELDPRPAREQISERYHHGGGWRPFKGFNVMDSSIQYKNDPPRALIAETTLRHETIRVYRGAWIGIFQPDGSYEIACVD